MISHINKLPRNAKYSVLLEPLWAIPGTIVLFYAPVYMQQVGLNSIQIGTINTATLFFSFLFQFFAGFITNKLGRKRATLIFDLTSWSMPMFIWAFSRNFWVFFVASIFNATSKIVTVSFNLLITEDAGDKQKSIVFGYMNLIIICAGILTPIAGIAIAQYGIVPSLSTIYFIGGFTMTILFFVRNAFSVETATGQEMIHKQKLISIAESTRNIFTAFYTMTKKPLLFGITIVNVITNFILQFTFFQVIYYKQYLGFSTSILSIIPVVSGIIVLLLNVFVVSRSSIRANRDYHNLLYSTLFSIIGASLLLIIPQGNLFILVIATAIISGSSFLLQTYRDAFMMNIIDQQEKADIFSNIQTMTMLFSIPSGYIAGVIYKSSPWIMFMIVVIMYIIVFLVILRSIKGNINIVEGKNEILA